MGSEENPDHPASGGRESPEGAADGGLTAAQKAEVDRRLAAHAADPSAAIPGERVEAEALARLARKRRP